MCIKGVPPAGVAVAVSPGAAAARNRLPGPAPRAPDSFERGIPAMKRLAFAAVTVLFGAGAVLPVGAGVSPDAPKPAGHVKDGSGRKYTVYRHLFLTRRIHGADGFLQLLQDVRLTEARRAAMWGSGVGSVDSSFAIGESNTLLSAFREAPLIGSALRIVDQEGRILEFREWPSAGLADLREERLDPSGRPTYLLTLDESTGMGVSSGPVTRLFAVVDGRIAWLTAVNGQTGRQEPMTFVSSLRSAWRIVPARDGRRKDILSVACRPSGGNGSRPADVFGNNPFVLSFRRYTFEGRGWVMRESSRPGFREFASSADFPDRALFP
jgi:hypothetical protein